MVLPSRFENAYLIPRAAIGNMFENLPATYPRYIQTVGQEEATVYNPEPEYVVNQLFQQAYEALSKRKFNRKDLLTIPWKTTNSNHLVKPSRLAASVIAYTDVLGKKIIPEFFPIDTIHMFLAHIEMQALRSGKPLTIPEQFSIAMQLTDNNPVAASILAHSSFRAIARGKDTKISSELSFPFEKVMDISRSTADFHTINSPSRDPLGDTYHWWGSFSAGLVFALSKRKGENPIQARIYNYAFYHEASLTNIFRGVVARRTKLRDHHKDVDRQGLQAGATIGEYLRNFPTMST